MNAALTELRDRYLEAQLGGDRAGALRVLDESVRAGLPVQALEVLVIGAAQREIGRLWEENAISVVDEHAATAISQLALAHLYRHLRREPRNGRTVVVACVDGEQHDMGPRIVTDHLDAAGFDVRLLGASVPAGEMVRHVAKVKPDLVALSATLSHHLPALRAVIAELRAARGEHLPIVVGGAAATGAALGAPNVHRSIGTPDDLVGLVRRLLGVNAA